MLEKQMSGHRVDRSICSWFWDHAPSQSEVSPIHDSYRNLIPFDLSFIVVAASNRQALPVIASPTHYLFHVVRDGITFLACTQVEMPPLMAIEFLCRVADVLTDYLGSLNEDLIKDNFVIVYQLLDEMMDNGFPLTTEDATTSSIPWRKTDLKGENNEVYVDIVEEMDEVVSSYSNYLCSMGIAINGGRVI
ncbi:hypothetical protein J5N97_016644 [Dioscorea zingiberensis]|uniref:AP complex mu/sigma subunit domain-containing protein n=1 Tax=Dioscorea zingiberensis TaxID=325984 RepID=A0A9D5CKS6_9LILI|nr:hypothetical protein J5N97_016644 [Dioscorea zingiberensis]